MHTKPALLRLALALGVLYCLGPVFVDGEGMPGRAAAWAAGDPLPPVADPPAPALPPPPTVEQPTKPAVAPPPAAPAGAGAPADTSGRAEKFQDLERRAFELKDQVFRSKARLTLLSETLVSNNVGTTRVVIVHKNGMGRLFQPTRVSYQIDGREIFTKEDAAGVMTDGKDVVVWDNGIKPGEHTVGVTVVYRGNGAKVFAYYDKFNFTARAAHRITTIEGQTTRLLVRCFEKGTALTAKVEERPEFEFKVAGEGARDKAAADDKPAAKRTDDKPPEAKAK